jgi:uncharacterized protein (TIGR01244 family)
MASKYDTIEYQLNDDVVLAGQPQPEEMAELAQRGFRTVINIRRDPERSAREAANAVAAGLDYIHLPIPAYELEPEHLDQFDAAMKDAEGPLYIHCRTASRTALLWMLNRIEHEGWSKDAAEAELKAVGYDEESMEVFEFCTMDYLERSAVVA